jgi:hypothetical protein
MYVPKFNYNLQKFFLAFLLSVTGRLIKKAQLKNQVLEIKTNAKNIYPLSLFKEALS